MLQEQQERECPLIGSKLSESEVVDRLVFGSTKVTKYFNGFGNFERTVIYACEYSTVTYFRVEWSDGDMEDLDATELLNFVDVATLAVERTMEKEMFNLADVPILSVKSPREIEQEQRHNKKARRQKPNLPPALREQLCLHTGCKRVAIYGFEGHAPWYCSQHKYRLEKEVLSGQKWGQTRYIPPGPRPLGEKKLKGSERNKKYNKKVKSEIEDVKSKIFSATEELSLHSEKIAEFEQ